MPALHLHTLVSRLGPTPDAARLSQLKARGDIADFFDAPKNLWVQLPEVAGRFYWLQQIKGEKSWSLHPERQTTARL